MSLNRRILLCAIAVLFSGLFIGLGFWQLSRRTERVSGAEARAARAAQARLEWSVPSDVPDDTAGLVGRNAQLTGRWDRTTSTTTAKRAASIIFFRLSSASRCSSPVFTIRNIRIWALCQSLWIDVR